MADFYVTGPAACPPDAVVKVDAGTAPNLASLTARIGRAWTLRGHHVWEAVDLLLPDLQHRRTDHEGRRFAELMESDALVEAVLLLTSLVEPRRFITGISNNELCWTCSMCCDRRQPAHAFKVVHADFAAALLIAFLRSYTDKLQRLRIAPGKDARDNGTGRPKTDEP